MPSIIRCFCLWGLLLTTSGAFSAETTVYNPLKIAEPSGVETKDLTIQDKERNREIPLRDLSRLESGRPNGKLNARQAALSTAAASSRTPKCEFLLL